MTYLPNIINLLKRSSLVILLFACSLIVQAQNSHVPQGTGGSSHTEQSQAYRRNFEESSGYDVPSGSLITQPWVWTLVAAGITLFIGLLYKNKTDRELEDTRSSTGH
jgi:hypothetical protein